MIGSGGEANHAGVGGIHIGPIGIVVTDVLFRDGDLRAGAVEGDARGRCGGVDRSCDGNIRRGSVVLESNRFDAEEVTAVDDEATVAEVVGVAAAIVAAAGECGGGVAEVGGGGADAEGAAGIIVADDDAEGCGYFQSASAVAGDVHEVGVGEGVCGDREFGVAHGSDAGIGADAGVGGDGVAVDVHDLDSGNHAEAGAVDGEGVVVTPVVDRAGGGAAGEPAVVGVLGRHADIEALVLRGVNGGARAGERKAAEQRGGV